MNNYRTISSFSEQFDWLSNFFPCEIKYKGFVFKTLEHAYQWEKCVNKSDKLLVLGAKTPGLAKEFANDPSVVRREDWDIAKLDVMKELLLIKFSDPELQAKLLATGDSILIEGNTWKDFFWGVCGGKGTNHLGRLLMEVRAEIREMF